MWKTIAGIAALAVAFAAYYIDNLIRQRRQLDGLVRSNPFTSIIL